MSNSFNDSDIPEQVKDPVDYSFNNIKKHFPFKTMRDGQIEALEFASKALQDDKIRFVVLQAPVGSGKSGCALALSGAVKDHKSYILTSNKMLQDQYTKDFHHLMSDLKGRSNYNCHNHINEKTKSPDYNCGKSPCRDTKESRSQCKSNWSCGYHKAFSKAEESDITLLNFAAALSQFNYNQRDIMHKLGRRELMVVDEAHLVESQLTGFMELSIKLEDVRENTETKNIPDDNSPAIAFIPVLTNLAKNLESELENDNVPNREKLEDRFQRCKNVLNEIMRDPGNIVIQKRQESDQDISLTFKPIDISYYAKNKLFNHCNKIVLMSATIVNYPEYIKSLGISPNESVYIDIPSTFPVENRPIIKAYVGKLNYSNTQELMPDLISFVKMILTHHHNQKGIIHVSSYRMASDIFQGLGRKLCNERILYPERSGDITEMIKRHSESERPTVLISPAMAEGLDLNEDLSRFSVICKVPYPSMGDKVVKARMSKNNNWLSYAAALKLIQSYGRSIRSETDKAVTYVLDGSMDDLIRRNGNNLPKWFTDAIKDGN